MAHQLSRLNRLRIERVVWSLDRRLFDLPSRARVETRREIRRNLISAAADVGTSEALSRLGDRQRLAADYLDAEFGDAIRPSYTGALFFILGIELVLNFLLDSANAAFADGLRAVNAHITGSFTNNGVPLLQERVVVTMHRGISEVTGGAWTPLAWVLVVGGTVFAGRLWRVVAVLRQRAADQPTDTMAAAS